MPGPRDTRHQAASTMYIALDQCSLHFRWPAALCSTPASLSLLHAEAIGMLHAGREAARRHDWLPPSAAEVLFYVLQMYRGAWLWHPSLTTPLKQHTTVFVTRTSSSQAWCQLLVDNKEAQ